MTLTPETQRALQEVGVRLSPDGTPLAVRHGGRVWAVDPDVHAAHWFTRDSWLDTQHRAPIGAGHLASVEHWQVQAKIPSANAALRMVMLRREPLSTHWVCGVDQIACRRTYTAASMWN